MGLNIYVASSWRNPYQPKVVELLRLHGHEVYDFREPEPGVTGFAWSDIDPAWEGWVPETFVAKLDHPVAVQGFDRDWEAMKWADAFVLVLPCGRSAHLELGWAVGQYKPTAILMARDDFEPELMYKMVDAVVSSPEALVAELAEWVWDDRAGVMWAWDDRAVVDQKPRNHW